MSTAKPERLIKLLQGYIWHPREEVVHLDAFLPRRFESDILILWDEMPSAPFAFFDDGTLSATQQFYQFTVVKPLAEEEDPASLIPWLAEFLQAKLETTPPSVGWQIFEDLRDV